MIRKKYLSMLAGATFSSVINALLIIVDSIICGLMLGEDAVTAIGIVSPIYNLGVFIAMALSLGIPILYSREVGKFQKEKADRVFGTGLATTIAGGVLIFVLMTIFRDAYLQQYNLSEDLFVLSSDYFRWVRFELLLMPVAEVMYEMVFNDGDETCTFIVSIVETVSNIVLSILFCRIMGIEGVALASFIAVCLRLLICMTHLLKKSNTLRLNLYFSPSVFLKSCTLSLDDASSYLSLSAFAAVLDFFVAWRFGSDMLIMAAMILTIQELALVFDGVGEAISPIITVYLSEDCYDGVRNVWKLALKTAIIEGVALTVFLIAFSGWIPALLGITDPALKSMASRGIVLMSFGMVGVSFMYLLASYYLLLDEILLAVSLSILSDAISPIIFVIIGGMLFGINGVFVGISVGSLMACAIALLFVYLRYGKENLPLMLADSEEEARSHIFDYKLFQLTVEPPNVFDLRQNVVALLQKNNVDSRTLGKVKLLVEELYMLISEKNEGKQVLSECAVFVRDDGVQVITKDDGVTFDISQEDVDVTSLAAFAVSGYMEKLGENRRHLNTLSFNRSVFLVKFASE